MATRRDAEFAARPREKLLIGQVTVSFINAMLLAAKSAA